MAPGLIERGEAGNARHQDGLHVDLLVGLLLCVSGHQDLHHVTIIHVPNDVPAAVEIVPATVDHWKDVRTVLDGSGEQGCWCQAWRGLDAKRLSGGRPRTQLLREQMESGPPPPGDIAYLDSEPVGWVGVGVRTEMPRLMN